jgi:hypothetical protein
MIFQEDITKEQQEEVYNAIEKNPYLFSKRSQYMFEADYKGQSVDIIAYSNIADIKMQAIAGDKLTEAENLTYTRKAVLPIYEGWADSPQIPKAEMLAEGEIELSGNKYSVAGEQSLPYVALNVPIVSAISDFRLVRATILFPVEINETQKSNLNIYFAEKLPFAGIQQPRAIEERSMEGISIFLFGGAIIGTAAIFTFVQLYLYQIRRDRREFLVMRICGCSEKRTRLVLLLQFALNYTGCFVVASLLAEIALLSFSQSIVPFSYILLIYGVFMSILVALTQFSLGKSIKRMR